MEPFRDPVIVSMRHLVLAVILCRSTVVSAQPDLSTVYSADQESGVCTWAAVDGAGAWYAELIPSGQGRVLTRIGSDGTMQWAKKFVDDGGSQQSFWLKAVASNGDLLAASVSSETGGGELDSAFVHAKVTRATPEGEVVWSAEAITEFWTITPTFTFGALVLGPNDDALLLMNSTEDRNILFKFSGDGQLLWTRWLRPGGQLEATFLVSDGAGGCFIACQPSALAAAFVVLHVDGAGELGSAHRFVQLAPSAFMSIMGMCPTADGGNILGGQCNVVGVNNYFFLLRLDAEGQLEWFNYYQRNGWGPLSTEAGSIVIDADQHIWMSDANGLIMAADDGDGVAGYELSVLQNAGIQTSWALRSLMAKPATDTVWMTGSLTEQDLVLGLSRSLAFISPVASSSIPCHLVPVDLLTNDAISALSVELSSATSEARFATSSLDGGNMVDVDIWSFSDMCQFVAVPEEEDHVRQPRLANNPSVAGVPIVILDACPGAVVIRNMLGQMVASQKIHDERAVNLPTDRLSPGQYVLEHTDENGRSLLRAKVMLAR